MAFRPTVMTPYYLADCATLSNTTWVATIVGTDAQPVRKLMIESTSDQPLEFGFDSGTGNTAAFYWIGVPHTVIFDLPSGLLGSTLYVRKLAGGTTPTANTVLAVSSLG